MMNPQGERILACLQAVAAERALRLADAALAQHVRAVKHYQHSRFQGTYADLLANARYGAAAQFFLDDLYGPGDFKARDEQFARVVPGLVRLFPGDTVTTVMNLGELHALSEQLDSAMGRVLCAEAPIGPVLTGERYGYCWRAVGAAADRERQIALMLTVGQALEGYTRNPLMRHTLRLMRGPANVAGLGALQSFLERGFDTFRAMRGAKEFLDTIASRERALAAALYSGGAGPDVVA